MSYALLKYFIFFVNRRLSFNLFLWLSVSFYFGWASTFFFFFRWVSTFFSVELQALWFLWACASIFQLRRVAAVCWWAGGALQSYLSMSNDSLRRASTLFLVVSRWLHWCFSRCILSSRCVLYPTTNRTFALPLPVIPTYYCLAGAARTSRLCKTKFNDYV